MRYLLLTLLKKVCYMKTTLNNHIDHLHKNTLIETFIIKLSNRKNNEDESIVISNNSMNTLEHKSCNNNTEIVGENISCGFSELLNPMEISTPNVYNWNYVPNSHRNDNDKKLTMQGRI